jgi:hypothetical protein
MDQPIWVTDSGSLGTYPTNSNLNIKLLALPAYPATDIAYALVSGYFPEPIENNQIRIDPKIGVITGIPKNIPQQTTYTFTIRAIDNYDSISDRTFYFNLVGSNSPRITTPSGELIHSMDSIYVNTKIEYTNPIESNIVGIVLMSGSLPPGLQLLDDGRILGYPTPPTLSNGSPTTITYTFTVQLVSDLGSDTNTYTITIANQQLTQGPNSRRPVLLNKEPLIYPIVSTNSLYNYYTTDGILPDVVTGSYFSFKAIGHDFDGSDITYKYFVLPPGLSGDPITGWITGYPTLPAVGIVRYKFTVRVEKTTNPLVNSGDIEFTLNVINGVVQDIAWITPGDLGSISNGAISTLSINAVSDETIVFTGNNTTSAFIVSGLTIIEPVVITIDDVEQTRDVDFVITYGIITFVKKIQDGVYQKNPPKLDAHIKVVKARELNYKIVSGHLPLNLTLLPNGEIIGRVAEQPTSTFIKSGTNVYYTFEALAYSPQYPLLKISQKFKLLLTFTHDVPLENVYVKALCSLPGRKVIQSLLTDEKIIPIELLYRPSDSYFGKATDVRYIHAYGLYSTYIDQYIQATQNHYERKIILGEIKTAIARDDNFKAIYEIVYSEIVDDLINENGKSIPSQITWPRNIPLNPGESNINNKTINISRTDYNVSRALKTTRFLNPESLPNMRNDLVTTIGQGSELAVLPKWMTSQQANGNILGYKPVWIICYALPGMASIIQNNIINKWPHRLNEIDFTVDRYFIDKSYSYNYNNRLLTPSWQELPSANPVPKPLDARDQTVLFPKKTIMPK